MPDSMDVLRRKAQQIRLVCTDVDGVLTDGGMYYSEGGDELKKFNTRDGMAVALLHDADTKVTFFTNENTELVDRRAAKLKIKHLFRGVADKQRAAEGLISELVLTWGQVAHIRDDINDLPVIDAVGLSATVSDGLEVIKRNVS